MLATSIDEVLVAEGYVPDVELVVVTFTPKYIYII
jgi:hypothetical protein